jgi:hypothetical protein
MVAGRRVVDVEELRSHTRYSGGLSEQSDEVRWFWDTFSSLDNAARGAVLAFFTAFSRLPAGKTVAIEIAGSSMNSDAHHYVAPYLRTVAACMAGSIDEHVVNVLDGKINLQDALLNALNFALL